MKSEMVKSKQLQHRLNFTLGREGMSLTMEAWVGGKVELGWALGGFLIFLLIHPWWGLPTLHDNIVEYWFLVALSN